MGLVFVDAVGRRRKPGALTGRLPGFHACYPEITLEIGFADRMIDRLRDSALIARSLAVNYGESCMAAGEAGLGIIQMPRYHVERQLAVLPQHPLPALPMVVVGLSPSSAPDAASAGVYRLARGGWCGPCPYQTRR